MRLLNTQNRTLEEFGGTGIPPYAILSHTWGKDEVTFQDISSGHADKKTGYERETLYRQCCLDLHAVVNFLLLAVRHEAPTNPNAAGGNMDVAAQPI